MMIEQQEPQQYPPPTPAEYYGPQPPVEPPAPTKKHNRAAWILAAIVGAVILLCLAGIVTAVGLIGGDKPEVTATGVVKPAASAIASAAPAEPVEEPTDADQGSGTTVRVGETLTVSGDADVDYTLVKTEQKLVDKWGDKASRGVFLLIYMKVTVKSGSDYICSCNLSFVTAGGKVYDSTWESFKGHEELDAVDLAAGQHTDGWVVFDVPKAAVAGAKIQLQPNTFQELYGYWQL
jgi:hypothetical protein